MRLPPCDQSSFQLHAGNVPIGASPICGIAVPAAVQLASATAKRIASCKRALVRFGAANARSIGTTLDSSKTGNRVSTTEDL